MDAGKEEGKVKVGAQFACACCEREKSTNESEPTGCFCIASEVT